MTESHSRRRIRPLFILFANMDPSSLPPEMLQRPDINGMIARIEVDYSKWPEAYLKLKTVLDQIIADEGKLTDSEELQYFLRVANELVQVYRVEDGKIVKVVRIGTHLPLYPKWLQGLSLNLAKFLSSAKNLQRIRRCDQCNRYFIASKADRRIKYCSICGKRERRTTEQRTRLVTQWRRKKSEDRLKKQREEHILRMMEAGYSRAEAEAEYELIKLIEQES